MPPKGGGVGVAMGVQALLEEGPCNLLGSGAHNGYQGLEGGSPCPLEGADEAAGGRGG